MAKIPTPLVRRPTSKAAQRRQKEEAARNIYGEDIARVSTVLDSWHDDPEEKIADWVAWQGFKWRETRDRAAEIGTHTHQMIEDCLKLVQMGEISFADVGKAIHSFQTISAGFQRVPVALRETVMRCFMGFVTWAARFPSLKVISLEETIIDRKLKIGGTCDFKGIVDWGEGPKRLLLDWKTSSKTHRKHKVQIGAYSHLHKVKYPNDPPFDFYGVIRFDREMGGFEEHYTNADDIVKDERFFLKLVELHHMSKDLVMF